MYIKTNLILILLALTLFACNEVAQDETKEITGEYFGQEPPGLQSELFASGIISTNMYELNTIFSPDGKEVFWSIVVAPGKWAMVSMKQTNGVWSEPEVASFNGEYGGVDMMYSPDGNRLYFCSNRPHDNETEPRTDFDIWYVNRVGSGWSEPVNLGYPINTDKHEFYPSLTSEGILYFQSRREGGFGQSDIYKSIPVNGEFLEVEILPEPINSEDAEGDVFIAPDESYIIVSAIREINYGSADLYISFRQEDGSWGEMINMGTEVNAGGGENCQVLSPCGKYLFFTGRRFKEIPKGKVLTYNDIKDLFSAPPVGGSDSYWVSAKIIDKLKLNLNEN